MKKSKLLAGIIVLALGLLVPLSTQSSTKDTDSTLSLSSNNVLILNDEVNGETVSAVVEKAKELDNKFTILGNNKPIYLFLSTPGGSIQSGLELIEQLKSLKRPVHTITLFAASMGFQIAQNLGTRYILKTGTLMSHRAKGGFEGEFGGQAPSQIDSRYSFWMARLNELDQNTVDRTGGKQTLASYQKAYASELWRTGTDAVAEGYADKVVKVSCDKSLSGVTTHTIMYMGLIPVSYDLSNCPMNTSPMNIRISVRTNKGIKSISEFNELAGGFGYACLELAAKDDKRVCAIDAALSPDKLYGAEQGFKAQFLDRQRQVIYMTLGK